MYRCSSTTGTIPSSLGYGTGKHLAKVVSGSCVQQPGFKTFRNLIAYHHRHISLEHIYFECSKVAITKEEWPPLLCTINS